MRVFLAVTAPLIFAAGTTLRTTSAVAAEKPPNLGEAVAAATRPAAPGAAKPEVKTEMRAVRTGQPGADGWVAARSEPGDFSVAFPGRYNDFSVHTKSAKGNPISMHSLGTNVPDRGKFSVTRTTGGDVEATDAAAKQLAKNLPGGYVRDLTLPDGPAYEVIINGARSCCARYYARGGTIIFAIVEYAPDARIPATAAADADRFFDSVKIDAAAPLP